MRATYWLVGCVLCIAGIGSAAAASLDTQDGDNAPHAPIDSAAPHDANTSSGGDALGLNRDCPLSNGSDNSTSTSGSGNGRSGGASS
ncbi:MAG TPA: hypothetical protein VGV14_04800, partial [Rhodanobacter sp.]|nr:hypothetical protein [Rhodanobacter sp.]